jgi:hypothetical protein
MILREKKFVSILVEREEYKDYRNIKIFLIKCKIAVNLDKQVNAILSCRY